MATKVMMEALSPTMEEGRLSKWLKNVGDAVKNGDTLAEVETDKAIMELVARGEGVLRARLIEEGATAPVGQTIGVIGTADEDISALSGGGAPAPASPAPVSAPAPAAAAPAAPAPAPAAPAPAPVAAASAPAAAAPTPAAPAATASAQHGDVVRSSPLARRMASEKGIELQNVTGSGPNGRIIRRDIDAAIANPPAAAAAAPAPSAPSAPSKPTATPAMVIEGDYKDVALTQIRKTIARRLSESIGPIPTFYLTTEIDMTRVTELREAMAAANEQFKVSVNDIVLKAVALSLVQHPECNAHWLGDHIRYFSRVHLGMAVATDDGLIVPVITDAQSKGLGQIGSEARSLAKRARERKLTPAEYTGSTFSVSNLGMFGIDQFTAIINPPESAILAIGSLETKPVWQNNEWVPQKRMRITMSCDHRVIDGAVGARFLQTLTQLLENPLRMMW